MAARLLAWHNARQTQLQGQAKEPDMDDDFNMSLRKFLKQVGVTSQQAVEEAVRNAGADARGKEFAARVVLSVEALGLTHVVEGKIRGPKA